MRSNSNSNNNNMNRTIKKVSKSPEKGKVNKIKPQFINKTKNNVGEEKNSVFKKLEKVT